MPSGGFGLASRKIFQLLPKTLEGFFIMPREITKYLCSYKCGTKAKSTLEQASYHEAICFKNPELRACTTCKHEIYQKESDYITDPYYMKHEYMVRACKILSDEQFNELIFMCDYHSKPKFHKQPVKKCMYWEAKNKKP